MGTRARVSLLVSLVMVLVAATTLALLAGDRTQQGEPSTTVTSNSEITSTSGTSTTGATTGSTATSVATTTSRPSTTAPVTIPSTTASTTTPTTAPANPPAIVVRRGPSTRPIVALTFDAGSDVGFAASILDTLRANGVPASFGITGTWAEAHPGVVRRMVAEGHQLVNHSYDHPSFTGVSTGTAPLSRSARLAQLARAEAAIRTASGISALPWFRPPYGDEDASVRADVGSVGYRYEVLWTVDSLGWRGLSASEIVQRCIDRVQPGAIYLFHVGSASADAAALQPLIDRLRATGYTFVTLAVLVAG
jgi:peptidoglycan/xylan/chitin deacetylase (PgdA/CDA1 family)